jgi:proline iminopeptidase
MAGYPVGEASRTGWLPVGDGHELYWEEAGNPDGVPALILHGGPGSGFSESMRRVFDPARYRIIGFDQRGAKRSRPSAAEPDADLTTNTTGHLVADIERLRDFFGVERWVLFGMSWGTTLGLAYAEAHPDRVAAMGYAGVTTTRAEEIDWLYHGIAPLFPEEWQKFTDLARSGTFGVELVAAYNDMMFASDVPVRERAARAFHDWDNASVSAGPRSGLPSDGVPLERMLSRGRIVTHYFRHLAWLEPGQILRGADRIRRIPMVLVQGRLDLQGPLTTAWELKQALPEAELRIIDGAGHSSSDAGMTEALAEAFDRFASGYM